MPLLSRNIRLGPALKLSSWRKVAIGTWRSAGDPSVYGILDLDATAAVAYVEKLRQTTGKRITLSHFVGKAIAATMARHPQINCILRFGRLYPRQNVDVFFQVASDDKGDDLSGMTIRNADKKSIPEIAEEMHLRIDAIRKRGDPDFKQMKGLMGLMPGALVGFMLSLSGWFMYTMNLWTPLLGTPRDPFGGAMITNIGSLGLDMAFAPLVPYSRVPLLIAVGAVADRPWVKDGKLGVTPVIRLCATIDHRLIDGVHASQMMKTLMRIFADPERELGLI
jgi:pyruvate/2-oxoglutarate dehydrogenase complex dihydrolipoamide acyltransferase (E2) component